MDRIYSKPDIGFVTVWFAATVITLVFAVVLSIYLNTNKVISFTGNQFGLYAALPDNEFSVDEHIEKRDARTKIIEDFFKGYNAPLAEFAGEFVTVADKYSLDWRLLPAISMQESNGGKKVIEGSYNPFGFGIYGEIVTRFTSWEESVERVGRALRTDYIDKGLKTPEEIMTKYNPPSLEKNGEWARGVLSFIEQLR